MNVLTFDLETRENPAAPEIGWKNHAAMGISLGCAYLSGPDEYRLYGEENIGELVRDMLAADLVVGYNIIQFDIPLLHATCERVGAELVDATQSRLKIPPSVWNHIATKCYDILADIREALGTPFAKGWTLDNVAGSTLPIRKNGDGALAPGLWKDGQIGKLATYVIQDVKVERFLFEHVRREAFVKNAAVGCERLDLKQIKKYQEAAI